MTVLTYIYRMSCYILLKDMEGYHLSSAEAPTSLQVHIISWKPALTRPSLKIWKEPGPNPSKMAQIWSESRYRRPQYRSKGLK